MITARCNLSCPHCYAQLFANEPEMSTEECKAFLEGLAEIGGDVCSFTGGEPLLRKDLFDLLEFAIDVGLSPHLLTNCTLVDGKVAEKLSRLNVSVITSLDGSKKETHELIRGRGTWEKTHRGIEELRSAGVLFAVLVAVNSHNYRECGEIVEHASQIGANRVCFLPTMKCGRASENLSLLPSPEQYLEGIRKAVEKAEELGFPTEAWCSPFLVRFVRSPYLWVWNCDEYALDVDPAGHLLLCDVLSERISSVKKGVREAWEEFLSHPLFRRVRERKADWDPCRDCKYREFCRGGCVARAIHIYGKIDAPDPMCPMTRSPSG